MKKFIWILFTSLLLTGCTTDTQRLIKGLAVNPIGWILIAAAGIIILGFFSAWMEDRKQNKSAK